MARVRACGGEFNATPLRKIDADTWEMRAEQHSGRVTPGTIFHCKANEILSMSPDEIPADNASGVETATGINQNMAFDPGLDMPMDGAGLAALEAAMAAERETLPSVSELLKPVQDKAKADREASEAANPKLAPLSRAALDQLLQAAIGSTLQVETQPLPPQGPPMSKMQAVVERVAKINDTLDSAAEKIMARLDKVEADARAHLAAQIAAVDAIEAQLTVP